jgi:Arc/MetJ-type ribon-helix-helix transcriptional regulator
VGWASRLGCGVERLCRYQTADDAIHDALARWEQNERARIELMASLDEAETDLEAGWYTDYTAETLPKLVDELKREGRALRQQP